MASEKHYGKYRLISKLFAASRADDAKESLSLFEDMVNHVLKDTTCELHGPPCVTMAVNDKYMEILIVQAFREVYYD